jgi:hypothetical protein
MPTRRKLVEDVQPITAPADGWVTVPATARSLRIAPQTVYVLAMKAELRTQMVNGRVFVHRDSIEEYRAKRNQSLVAVG